MNCFFCKKELVKGFRNIFTTFNCRDDLDFKGCGRYWSDWEVDGPLFEERFSFRPDFTLIKNYFPTTKGFYLKMLRKISSRKQGNATSQSYGQLGFATDKIIKIPEFEIPDDYFKLREKLEMIITFQ